MKKLAVTFGVRKLMTDRENNQANRLMVTLHKSFGRSYIIVELKLKPVPNGNSNRYEWNSCFHCDALIAVLFRTPPKRIVLELRDLADKRDKKTPPVLVLGGNYAVGEPQNYSMLCVGLRDTENSYRFLSWSPFDGRREFASKVKDFLKQHE